MSAVQVIEAALCLFAYAAAWACLIWAAAWLVSLVWREQR